MLQVSVSLLLALTGASACALTAAAVLYLATKEGNRVKGEGNKKRAGRVSELAVYPIKACPGLRVNRAVCTEAGLKYFSFADRQFMIVSGDTYVRIASNLNLSKLQLSYDESSDCLVLVGPGMDRSLMIHSQELEDDPALVKSVKWFDGTEVLYREVSQQHSEWFSQYLGKECMFVTTPLGVTREVNPQHTYSRAPNRHPLTKILFTGTHPYLVINQSSLDEISSRSSVEYGNDSFRGNIVISGREDITLAPYDEDIWTEIYIGPDAVLYNERACPRCAAINIDHPRARMRENKEPTSTLLKYRRGTKGRDKYVPTFGANASLITEGVIAVGDEVVVCLK